jgi:diguanylate cyclase (GGDEF)-like protein/PAS domain S-box-containing protein
LGYTKDEFENDSVTFASCIHPEDISTVMKEVKTHTAENNNFFTHRPYRIITKDGEVKWVLDNTVLIRDDDNKITHYLGYLSDVTIFKEHENKLEYLSITDQLTKVHNRLHTDEVLQTQYYRHFRNNEECGVILIDIDYFKSINDTFGHIVGDLFLVEFANLLQMNVRESDIIGRWGGEEFLIILPHTNLDATCISANKLKEIIEKNDFSKVGHKTASFGVSSFGVGVSVEQVIENADKALYTSKENGRNQVTC